MKVATSLFLLSVLPLSLLAKEKPRVTVEVVNSQQSVRHWTEHILGTDSRSQTNCDTNGTATDTGGDTASINATTNCSTTTTPGTPARTVEHSIAQEHVYAIMPDGSHVTLWCQNGFRRCESLSAGSTRRKSMAIRCGYTVTNSTGKNGKSSTTTLAVGSLSAYSRSSRTFEPRAPSGEEPERTRSKDTHRRRCNTCLSRDEVPKTTASYRQSSRRHLLNPFTQPLLY